MTHRWLAGVMLFVEFVALSPVRADATGVLTPEQIMAAPECERYLDSKPTWVKLVQFNRDYHLIEAVALSGATVAVWSRLSGAKAVAESTALYRSASELFYQASRLETLGIDAGGVAVKAFELSDAATALAAKKSMFKWRLISGAAVSVFSVISMVALDVLFPEVAGGDSMEQEAELLIQEPARLYRMKDEVACEYLVMIGAVAAAFRRFEAKLAQVDRSVDWDAVNISAKASRQ